MLNSWTLWVVTAVELLELGVDDDGDDDGAAVGLAATVSSGRGWNGSRVLSASTTVAGVATAALGVGDAFGATVAVEEGLATGPVALLSLEPLFFKTRK